MVSLFLGFVTIKYNEIWQNIINWTKLYFNNDIILIMTSACVWIRGYQTPWLEPSPSLRVQHGDTVGNARFVWWYKRVARPKNGGRRWKSESSWMPFGNGEFGVNIIAVWRHVNATVQSLTFTSDSTDFILTYHSQWMHIQVNYHRWPNLDDFYKLGCSQSPVLP